MRVDGAKNVNAMGALVKYPVADFEFVKGSIQVTDGAKGMVNKSGNYTFGEELDSVNIALANKGDQELYAGSEDIATFQLTAKRDCEVTLDSQAWLIGPAQDFVAAGEGEVTPPVDEVKEIGQDGFAITMTNEKLPEDDGANVEKLIQQNGYEGLFDGDEGANGFEFKWDIADNQQDGKLPEYVMLPTTMHFELKRPVVMRDVQIVNRDTYNGTVTSLEAVITYTDGTTTEFKGGEFAEKQAVYTLAAEKGKQVKRIDITPLTSEGAASGYEGDAAKNRMLTLREINFRYAEADQKPEAEVDKSALAAKVAELKDLANDGYTDESWDAFQKALEAAQAVLDNAEATQQDADGALKALTDAHAGLVKPEAPQVDKSALAAKVEELKGLASDGYTADSWKAFADALAVAQGALDSADATQQQIDDALKALEAAHAGLVKGEGQGGTGGGQGQGGTGGQGGSGSTGSGDAGAQGKPNGKPGTSGGLAQTGDATAIAVGATGVVGAISAAVGALLRRRRRD